MVDNKRAVNDPCYLLFTYNGSIFTVQNEQILVNNPILCRQNRMH